MRKSFYIETYGCQMNFCLSSQIKSLLEKKGLIFVDNFQNADFIILNGCSVREHAEIKLLNRIKYLNSVKNEKQKIIVTGCFAQHLKEKIPADIIVGTYHYGDIPQYILKQINHWIETSQERYNFLPVAPEIDAPYRSYIDITVGCDNYCTYCIVPYLRGPQISRPSSEVLNEIKRVVDLGVIEIYLLGQNVNSYGKDLNENITFADLLYKISKIEGVKRIRFLTSHPKDFTDEIIEAVFSIPQVVRYIHLPVQSGSNKILKLMNRKYTREYYLKLIDKIKSQKKDYSLSTDFLIGFPGETEKDFMETISLLEEVGFDRAYMFKFSVRDFIPAAKFDNQIPEEEKKRRLNYLIQKQKEKEKQVLKRHIGKKREVLIEKKAKKDKNSVVGTDDVGLPVVISEKLPAGKIYTVKIEKIEGLTLKASLQ